MIPYQKANLKQNWELTSFVLTQNSEVCKAISTAYVFPPVPFETFLPASAQKASENLKVEGLETYIFKNNEPGNHGVTSRKTSVMIGGCYNHFEEIYKIITGKLNLNLEEELNLDMPFEIVTFVYKPTQNGWIVINSNKNKEQYQTSLHTSANKANRIKEVLDQETLYYNNSISDIFRPLNLIEALKKHFDLVIEEADNTSGHFSGMEKLDFDKTRLKQLLCIK